LHENASKSDFVNEPQSLAAIKMNSSLLAKISVERTLVEFQKMMLGTNPNRGLADMVATRLHEYCPGLAGKGAVLQELLAYPLSQLENETQIWALLAWMLQLRGAQINRFLKQWKTSNELIRHVTATVRVLSMLDSTGVDRIILFEAGANNVANAVRVAQILGHDAQGWLDTYQTLQIKSSKELAVTGKDLIANQIVTPGPQMGRILNSLKAMVINDQLPNQPEALFTAARKLGKDD
ncbi:CCA tRNA nucleotidyltransferase, partial [Pediococcus acidilactici]|nr:CCA tRNA nucleotidyltransferase [Pediococcus acidilactici]